MLTSLLLFAANLVANPDLEALVGKEVAGWSLPRPQFAVRDGVGRAGSRGLVWKNDDPRAYALAHSRVAITPGTAYDFGGWVKVVSSCAASCAAGYYFDFYSKDGKWLDGCSSRMGRTVGAWTKLEGVTAHAPADAAYGELLAYAARGSTGEAVFDDAFATAKHETFLGEVWCSAYRNAVAEGTVRFFAEFNPFAPLARAPGLKMAFRLPDGRDERWVELKTRREKDFAVAEADISAFRHGTAPVQFRIETNGVYVDSKTIFFTRYRERDPRRVHFDSRNRTIVDGKAIFPIGLFTDHIPPKDVDLLTQGGFNCVMAYWAKGLNHETLDYCAKKGLFVIPSIKDSFPGERHCLPEVTDAATGEAWVGEIVSRFKDHPAILAWYSCDESELNILPQLRARQKLLERIDPDHPTWEVLYQAPKIRQYMGSFDVVGTDPYPIADLGQYPNAGDGIRRVSDWTRLTRQGVFEGNRPMWQVPQCFDWAIIRKTEAERLAAPSRAPTEDEIRNMTWQCLAEGANGIVYWAFHYLRPMDKRTPFEQSFGAVSHVAKEVRAFEKFFLEGTSEVVATENAWIVARRWTRNGATLLAIVNASEKPQTGRVDGRKCDLKPLEVRLVPSDKEDTWELAAARIVLPAKPNEYQKAGAGELRHHLELMAGAKLTPAAGGLEFVFAPPPGAAPAKDFESFCRVEKGRVYFWGDDGGGRYGSQFAVYAFLNKLLGVDWTYPGEDGIVFRHQTRVRLPARWEDRYYPPLKQTIIRNYWGSPKVVAKENMVPPGLRLNLDAALARISDNARWYLRRRLLTREKRSYGHAFGDWQNRFLKTHPEYLCQAYPNDPGRGLPHDSNGFTYGKLCVSCEGAVDQIVADWVQRGKPRYLNICENDGDCYYCRCAACCALDVPRPGDGPFNRAHKTDRYVNFWNRVSGKARALRPDVECMAYVYSEYRLPPRREKLACPDNMFLGVVPSLFDDCRAACTAWQAAGLRHFFLRPNFLAYWGVVPRGCEKAIYDNFQTAREFGLTGVDFDGYPGRSATQIEYYVTARMIAEPEGRFEDFERDFCAAYGAAADIARDYFARVRARGERFINETRARGVPTPGDGTYDHTMKVHTVAELESDVAFLAERVRAGIAFRENKCRRRLDELRIRAQHAVLAQRFYDAAAAKDVKRREETAAALLAFRREHRAALPDFYANLFGNTFACGESWAWRETQTYRAAMAE